MKPTLSLRSSAVAFASLVLVGMVGCDVIEQARQSAGELRGADFDTATRTPAEFDPEGVFFTLRVEARDRAHWYQAWSAMSRDLGTYCPDGVPYSNVRMTPEHDLRGGEPGEYTWHPAGTVFEQEIRCTTPFAGEHRIATDADDLRTLAALKTELAGDNGFDPGRHLHTMAPFSDRTPKYRSISAAIGDMMLRVHGRCGEAGIDLNRVLIHSKPTPAPADGVFLNRSMAYVGIDATCAGDPPPVPRR